MLNAECEQRQHTVHIHLFIHTREVLENRQEWKILVGLIEAIGSSQYTRRRQEIDV